MNKAPWIPVAHSVGFAPLSPSRKGYVQSPFGYDAFYGVSVDGKIINGLYQPLQLQGLLL